MTSGKKGGRERMVKTVHGVNMDGKWGRGKLQERWEDEVKELLM